MDRNPYNCKNRGIQSPLKPKRSHGNRRRSYSGQATRRIGTIRRDSRHKIIKNNQDRLNRPLKQEMDSDSRKRVIEKKVKRMILYTFILMCL